MSLREWFENGLSHKGLPGISRRFFYKSPGYIRQPAFVRAPRNRALQIHLKRKYINAGSNLQRLLWHNIPATLFHNLPLSGFSEMYNCRLDLLIIKLKGLFSYFCCLLPKLYKLKK